MTTIPTRAIKFHKVIISAQKQSKIEIIKKYEPRETLAIFMEGDFGR